MTAEPLVIWRLLDGKAGHENQTAGLLQALRSLRPVAAYELRTVRSLPSAAAALLSWFPWADTLPDPDLIIGAGQATHVALLAARRARGGRSVVLMRPALPVTWYDLCLIPAHDRPPPAANVVVTHGVLNRIRPGAAKDPHKGLILIGGPSRHHAWSNAQIIQQLRAIIERTPQRHWLLTTSRRTPADFLPALQAQLHADTVEVVPYEQTTPDWLPMQLAWAAQVWVTEDSISMLYESLTSGAAVGLIEVPVHKRDRVVQGVEALLAEGLVTDFTTWNSGGELRAPKQSFNEAARCAQDIIRRWYNGA